jgi:DNA-directed RNA polymerase subunit E'/Rpb7
LVNIKDNYISSNCQNIFIVVFDAEILKPEVGKIFEGVVCMIFGSGIFINIYNKLKVLIPLSSIPEYEYNSSSNQFEKKTKIIKQNDTVKVKISGTKYSKQSYSCFGTIEED